MLTVGNPEWAVVITLTEVMPVELKNTIPCIVRKLVLYWDDTRSAVDYEQLTLDDALCTMFCLINVNCNFHIVPLAII